MDLPSEYPSFPLLKEFVMEALLDNGGHIKRCKYDCVEILDDNKHKVDFFIVEKFLSGLTEAEFETLAIGEEREQAKIGLKDPAAAKELDKLFVNF